MPSPAAGGWERALCHDYRHFRFLYFPDHLVLTVFAWFKTIPSLYLVYIFSWLITAAFENWYFFRCYRKLPA